MQSLSDTPVGCIRRQDAARTHSASSTPWVVAVGIVLLALLSASCMETPSQVQTSAKGDNTHGCQATTLDESSSAKASSEWTIDDVESVGASSFRCLSPALVITGPTIVDFFSGPRYDAPDTIRLGSTQPKQLPQSTTVVAAPVPSRIAAPTLAPQYAASTTDPAAPSRVGTVTKSPRPVPAAKMTEAQIAAYLASLKVCQPPFPARAATVAATAAAAVPNPTLHAAWSRGGPRPIGAGSDTPQTEQAADLAHTELAVTTQQTSTLPSSPPVAAVALAPVHIPAARPVWVGLLGMTLGLAAFGAGLLTVGLGFAHARTTDRGGNTRRSLTLRARFTLAFGAMATLGLLACALAAGLMVVSVPGAIQIAACAVVSIAAPVGLWLWLHMAIVEPVTRASGAVNSIASGDLLRAPLNSTARDECGELCRGIDRLAATMRDALTEVAISATAVSGAANQIASGSQLMADSVGSVMTQCTDSATSAAEASRAAIEGQSALRKTAEDIQRVHDITGLQTKGTQSIKARADRTARLVQLIEDLADRSHLIALNASVEASRAGTASGPFGQFAEEVRRVAETAQNAVAEVSRTVESLDADVQSVREQASETSIHARHGAEQAKAADEGLARIAGRTEAVAEVTRSAASAAEEAGADAVQSAAIAAQLSSRTNDIMAVVGRFKLGTEKLIRQAPASSVAVPTDRP